MIGVWMKMEIADEIKYVKVKTYCTNESKKHHSEMGNSKNI